MKKKIIKVDQKKIKKIAKDNNIDKNVLLAVTQATLKMKTEK